MAQLPQWSVVGLDPAIHSVTVAIVSSATEWMPWSSHGMTTEDVRA